MYNNCFYVLEKKSTKRIYYTIRSKVYDYADFTCLQHKRNKSLAPTEILSSVWNHCSAFRLFFQIENNVSLRFAPRWPVGFCTHNTTLSLAYRCLLWNNDYYCFLLVTCIYEYYSYWKRLLICIYYNAAAQQAKVIV